MSNNLELWNKVEKTNPAHTKPVKLGRTITAIDPYRQIKNATEQFGAAGEGWGWSVVDTKFLPTNEVACLVRLWHGSADKHIEQWGQNGLFIDKAEKKKDTDCMKKATTDGLTKCLSMLGFNADVFLGKFDDNKYVQSLNVEFNEVLKEAEKAIREGLSNDDSLKVRESWDELSEQEKTNIWKVFHSKDKSKIREMLAKGLEDK